jgi:TolB-like protein/class 3 adenylate cyclase
MPPVRRLTAILAADVAGYSRLMGADEEGTHERLRAHLRELIEPKVADDRGRIVKNTGDGFLAEFASVVDAVRCGVEVQRGMADRNAGSPPEKRIEFRVGVNLGDVIAEGEDIFGDGVNVAARLEGLAEPGGVLVSKTVHEHVRDRLPFPFEDLGEHQVKNIARPVRIYRVWDSIAPAKRDTPASAQVLPLPDKPSIAVLPFQNMSGDPDQEYFADGMVEEIITALSRIRWLFVIARNSSFTYKGPAIDVKQVGRELGVRYVLEGSVRKAGNRVRITGQLIDAATGAHIWAEHFNGALDDIFELQDQVASSVVGAIEPRLRRSEIERAVRKPTESLDAYDLYLRALAQFNSYTEEGVREAIALLQLALSIDPSCAPAAAMVGCCRITQRQQGWGPLSDAEVVEAVRLARGAGEAGKDDPDTLWMAAFCLSVFTGAHAAAASAIDRALTLNPNSAQAWNASGWVSCFQHQPDPAIQAFRRATRLSPLDPRGWGSIIGLAFAHMIAGRYEEAIDWSDRCLHEQPRSILAMRVKIICCAHLGSIEEAHCWLERLLEVQPGLTIARWKALYAATLFAPEILAMYVEGLRKAGMPEE